MLRDAALLSVLLAVPAPLAAAPPQLPIAMINEQHEALNGRLVRLRGWLQDCRRFNCSLNQRADGKGAAISLGEAPEFDGELLPYRKRLIEVLVEGRIRRNCFDHSRDAGKDPEVIEVCTDRGDQVSRPRIVKIHTSRPRRAEIH